MLTRRSLNTVLLTVSLIGSATAAALSPGMASAGEGKHAGKDPFSCDNDAKDAAFKTACKAAKVATYKDVQNLMKKWVEPFKKADKKIGGELEAKCVSCHEDGAGLKGLKSGADKHFGAMMAGPK
jgi:hypothetical protein